MSTRDRVKLTAVEREQLAAMQATLEASDPELAQVLKARAVPPTEEAPTGGSESAGGTGTRHKAAEFCAAAYRWSARLRTPVRQAAHRAGRSGWAGPVLAVLGVALITTGALLLPWLSAPGAVLAGAGAGLCVVTLRRWRLGRRAKAKGGGVPAPRRSEGEPAL